MLDPAHLAPSRTDASSNGHFPPANGQVPTGTPRGFNLQNFAINNMMTMPGFPLPNAFPPIFASPIQAAATGWNASGGETRDGPGPVRRGGGNQGRYQNRTGPYDRRQNPRWNSDGGAALLSGPGRLSRDAASRATKTWTMLRVGLVGS